MYISWNWLSRHVDLEGLDPREVGNQLTLRVAELDDIKEIGAGLDAFRTVLIEHVEPVEGADKLSKVRVRDGDTVHQLVCGAPNVRDAVGQVAVHAPPGSTLPGGQAIGHATIRGVESAGMLASEKELGLSDEHAGILIFRSGVEAGQSFPDAVPVHDWIFEVDNKAITHRPDLWGHRGIAREISVLMDRPMKPLDLDVAFGSKQTVAASVEAPDLCPRYMCAHLDGVTVAPSPQWLQWLLKATGVRPISNVVDLTNFVMMDLGNPMHAFDARFVAGGDTADHEIVVRRAREGEVLRTLDSQDRACDADTLLICDADKPVALAGVMGGENSEIRDDTTEVILEAANFLDRNVRQTSTRLHLRSESSARFEKALDPALADDAARLFCKLMVELIDGCRVVSPLVDIASAKAPEVWISLDPAHVSTRLGADIGVGQIRSVLGRLGFTVQDQSSGLLRVKVPSWRATKDVAIAEDLIEEVGRMHGYINIAPRTPTVAVQAPRLPIQKLQERRVRQFLSYGAGMNEVLSYAFTQRPMLERLGADLGGRVEMANTISQDLDRMRRYLMPNLLTFAERNARFRDHYALYEIGRIFRPVAGELPEQPRFVGFIDTRKAETPEQAFRRVRGVIEGLVADLGGPAVQFERPTSDQLAHRPWIHPARSAIVTLSGQEIGYLSLLHPRAGKVLSLKSAPAFAELNLDAILAAEPAEVKYEALPKFPESAYDVSFQVSESVTAAQLEAAIRETLDTEWLRRCTLFANYHLGDGTKSVSFHLVFRADDRSLTGDEVNDAVNAMITAVQEQLGATLRGG